MAIKAVLTAWDAVNYLASVEPVGTQSADISAVPVARNIAAAAMVLGRYVAVETFGSPGPAEAVVVAVWT